MRILATFSGSFALGIFLLQYGLPVSWALPAALLFVLCGWCALLLPRKFRRRAVLICSGLALALCWNWFYVRQVQAPLLTLAETEQTAEMTICDYPTQTNYGARATVKLNHYPYGKAVFYGDFSLLDHVPGETVRVFVHIQSAARIRDEDVTTFTSKGIHLLCYNRGTPVYGSGTADSPRWWPVRAGHAVQEKIQELLHDEEAAFMTAILTGNRLLLSEEASAHLSEAGLLHILAVSGMHCGFLLTMVTLVIGRHRRLLMALTALPLLIFYAALTGGSPSVLRACTMLSLFVLAPLMDRDNDGITSLSAALFLILLQNPFAAASVSLQLSFGAMLGILWITRPLYNLLNSSKKHGKCFHFIIAGFSTTIGALLITVPLSAFYFNSLALISPISNLLCLWAASLVFMLGLIAVLIGFVIPPLGALLAYIPALLIRYILATAGFLSWIPYHAVYFSNPYLKFWLVFFYLLFAVACLSKRRRRACGLATVLGAGTLVFTVFLGAHRYQGDLEAMVLNIGQGQCVLLASQQNFALVDCGSANPHSISGEIAAEELQTMGCHSLDYLLLTHYDFDHVSGIRGLMARLPVKTLLIPDTWDDSGLREQVMDIAQAHGTAIQTVTERKNIPFGQAALTVYPPVGTEGDNEMGLTCLATTGDQDFLMTGDMNVHTEELLLDTYALPDLEAMVAGHHGAKTSTGDALLEKLTPEIVCISAGKHNRFHHPSDETLRRLHQHGCQIFRTDMQGHIHLTFTQGDHYGI